MGGRQGKEGTGRERRGRDMPLKPQAEFCYLTNISVVGAISLKAIREKNFIITIPPFCSFIYLEGNRASGPGSTKGDN